MSQQNIPHLKTWKRDNLHISTTGDEINLYYNNSSSKMLFHTKTSCWACPFGKDEQNKLMAVVSDDEYFKLEELDLYGKDICKYMLNKENVEYDEEELPYKSLLSKQEGLDVLNLSLSDRTRIFDNNGVKLNPDEITQFTSGQFSGYFLLSYSLRIWRTGNEITKMYWIVNPVQIRIKQYCTLPEGCQIFDNEEDLNIELKQRKKVLIKTRAVEEEPVVSFDPDVNELLDN